MFYITLKATIKKLYKHKNSQKIKSRNFHLDEDQNKKSITRKEKKRRSKYKHEHNKQFKHNEYTLICNLFIGINILDPVITKYS